MPSATDLKIARRYRELACSRFPDEIIEVRIFGSRARDQAHENSDLDLFVLTKTDRQRGELQALGFDVGQEFGFVYPIVPLVLSKVSFEELRERERRIAQDIDRFGISV